MRIEILSLDDAKKYVKLDHFGMLKRLVFPNYFAVCAIERVKGKDVPAGIAVASETENGVYIDWLFVKNSFRNMGFGKALLTKIFDVAVELDKPNVFFRIYRKMFTPEKYEEVKKYLMRHMFSDTGKKYSEYNIDLASFTDDTVIAVDRKKTLKAKPLGILKPAEIRTAIKSLMGESTSMTLYDVKQYPLVFDAKLSSVLMFEDEACGLMLVKSTGRELYPVFMYSESPQETSALMVCSGLLASLYMPENAIIRFLFDDKNMQKYLKGVFPDFRYDVELMSADMSDYIGDMDIDDFDYDLDDDFDDDDFEENYDEDTEYIDDYDEDIDEDDSVDDEEDKDDSVDDEEDEDDSDIDDYEEEVDDSDIDDYEEDDDNEEDE